MRFITALAALVIVQGMSYGQNASPTLSFEAASVKPAAPADGKGRTVRATGIPGSPFGKDPGRFTAENFSLPNLITMAYALPPYRLSGADDLNMVMFNIEAKMPLDTTKEQFDLMLQNLLAERFGLKVHWIDRQMSMYDLVVAKGGSKLKAGAPDQPSESDDSPSRLKGSNDPPKRRPASATRALVTAAPALPDGASSGAADPDGPSLFVALQEQLGLKNWRQKKDPCRC